MIFSNHKSIEHRISIDGVNLQKVDSLKFLGVCIDHQITWKDHITYITSFQSCLWVESIISYLTSFPSFFPTCIFHHE